MFVITHRRANCSVAAHMQPVISIAGGTVGIRAATDGVRLTCTVSQAAPTQPALPPQQAPVATFGAAAQQRLVGRNLYILYN